jgi:hypothetical protein
MMDGEWMNDEWMKEGGQRPVVVWMSATKCEKKKRRRCRRQAGNLEDVADVRREHFSRSKKDMWPPIIMGSSSVERPIANRPKYAR